MDQTFQLDSLLQDVCNSSRSWPSTYIDGKICFELLKRREGVMQEGTPFHTMD